MYISFSTQHFLHGVVVYYCRTQGFEDPSEVMFDGEFVTWLDHSWGNLISYSVELNIEEIIHLSFKTLFYLITNLTDCVFYV